MTITIPSPDQVPVWVWVTLGVIMWYACAAVLMRYTRVGAVYRNTDDRDVPLAFGFLFWLLSPFTFPVCGFIACVCAPIARFVTRRD